MSTETANLIEVITARVSLMREYREEPRGIYSVFFLTDEHGNVPKLTKTLLEHMSGIHLVLVNPYLDSAIHSVREKTAIAVLSTNITNSNMALISNTNSEALCKSMYNSLKKAAQVFSMRPLELTLELLRE